jgi:glycosyltransferase involved in cell wall biosynthesis
MKRILHAPPLVGRSSFGIGPIVLSLAATQQSLGNMADIWCYDTAVEARHLEASHSLQSQTIRPFSTFGPNRLGYSPSLERSIIKEGLSYDIIHQHGIWTGISHALNRWRACSRRPTIIAPQGSLEPWALRKSSWKKQVALMLYENQNLHNVSCMQALSMREATDFRSFGLRNPIAIIPNGVSDVWMAQDHDSKRFRLQHNIPDELNIMLFLGRITPKKGLPMLLHAMNNNRDQLKNWRLIVAGANEYNHQQEVLRLVEDLALQPYVQFVGPLFDQNKRDAFAAADLFVLPSHSEGAPMAILEALGAAVPVLTTKASPWEELITHNCGWWTEISAESIADALQHALCQPRAALREMGQRGKQLVCERYTWRRIAEQTLALYSWLIDGGSKPDFVITE